MRHPERVRRKLATEDESKDLLCCFSGQPIIQTVLNSPKVQRSRSLGFPLPVFLSAPPPRLFQTQTLEREVEGSRGFFLLSILHQGVLTIPRLLLGTIHHHGFLKAQPSRCKALSENTTLVIIRTVRGPSHRVTIRDRDQSGGSNPDKKRLGRAEYSLPAKAAITNVHLIELPESIWQR